jgi:hypothetical protein
MNGSRTISLLLTLFSAIPLVHAQEELPPEGSFAGSRAELGSALIPELEVLAIESRKVRLYGECDRLYGLILELDPQHRDARRTLRFHKLRGDRWVQARGYRPRRNRNESKLDEYRSRIEKELESYRNSLLILIETYRDSLGLRGFEEEMEWLLSLNPDDVVVRGVVGEVLVEGKWLLEESVIARRHRRSFPSLAGACLTRAPEPEEGEVRSEEKALSIPWNAAKKTEAVRIIGTTGTQEASHTARVTHAVGDFFRYVFAVDQQARDDYTVYLLTQGQAMQLVEQWPGLRDSTRAGLRSAVGGWLDAPNRLAEWSPNPNRRLDGAARQTLGTLLMDTFGVDGRCGWAWEGVGMYMVHDLLGTRLTWFFDTEGYQPSSSTGLWMKLQDPSLDWFAEAAKLLEGENPPRLAYLLGRGVNSMREMDVLYAYVLAAYLMEGHPDKTPTILRRVGSGEHPVKVFEEELGYTVPTIENRLKRWLRESRGR